MPTAPTNPPSAQLDALSLSSENAPARSDDQTPITRPIPRTFGFSFTSPSSDSSSASGGFQFSQPQSSSPSQTLNTPEQQAKIPSTLFTFGGPGQGFAPTTNDSLPFSFRTLHNVTPLPSPTPSRLSSPQSSSTLLPSTPSQSPFRFVSSPPTSTFHTPSSRHSQAPLFSLGVPLTPPSAARPRTLSVASSPSSASGQARDSTPNTQQRFRSVSEVSTPLTKPPYNAQDELAPSHPFFTPVFQTALKNGSKIANDAVVAIEKLAGCGLTESDADLRSLLEDAKSLRRFQGSDTRTVAVLGDSGEGKSSLINSLLHLPGIAQTADIGSACTSVVTEYRQKKAEHVAPITIEVEYLSSSGIKELVQELLWSYRQLYLPGVESDDTPEQDYLRYMRESDQAWSALHSAFQHERRFSKEFLRDMSEGALERITNQLLQWAEAIQWPSGGADGFWVDVAQTADECCKKTRVFMQEKYWPFTKIIRVYLNSQVLKTGVVLADLPGLQDTNLARVRATQEYLVKCDNIFIVAKIARAVTDQSLKSSLFMVLSRHVPMEWEQSGGQNFKLAVVCTRSEDIDLEAARSEFCGPNKRVSPQVMAQLEEEFDVAESTNDKVKKKAAKRKIELLLIQARNDHVKEGLQRAYASDIQGRALDVFCVSNKLYKKYCQKGNTEYVMASGVPELRRFCHSMTADAQLAESKHFLLSKLSTLLNSLGLWASSSQHEERGEEVTVNDSIYDTLDSVVREMPNLVARFRQAFHTCFQEQIMDLLARRDQHWEQVAGAEGRKWQSWHWTQYNAWCRNNGNHETLKLGHQDWNAKIIWKMRMELEFQWDLVEEEVPESFSVLLGEMRSLLEGLKTRIQETTKSEYTTHLLNGIDFQIQNLEYRISREERTFISEVKTIRKHSSESNYNSYVLKDMMPSYRSASSQEVKGRGMSARQKAIVQGHIEDGTLFLNLAISISTSMDEAIAVAGRRLDQVAHDVLESIKNDVNMAFQHPTQVEQRLERDEETKTLLGKLSRTVSALKQRHECLTQGIEAI